MTKVRLGNSFMEVKFKVRFLRINTILIEEIHLPYKSLSFNTVQGRFLLYCKDICLALPNMIVPSFELPCVFFRTTLPSSVIVLGARIDGCMNHCYMQSVASSFITELQDF
jgi:hypothetical protein